jgi:hypothetical protein
MAFSKSPSTHTHMPASAQAVVSYFPNKGETHHGPDSGHQKNRESEKPKKIKMK